MGNWNRSTRLFTFLATAFYVCIAILSPCFADQTDMRPEHVSSSQNVIDIIFVIDNSGSMKTNDPDFVTKKVVTDFTDFLTDSTWIGLVLFDITAQLAQPLIEMSHPEFRNIFSHRLEKVTYRGKFTNTADGIVKAIYELKNRGREHSQKIIIFLTDGIIDTGNEVIDREKTKWLTEEVAAECKKAAIQIISIAFTEKADIQLIQSLASKTGGDYFIAEHINEIPSIFNKINTLLTKHTSNPTPSSSSSNASIASEAPQQENTGHQQHTSAPLISPPPEKNVEAYHLPESPLPNKSIYLLMLLISLSLCTGIFIVGLFWAHRKFSSQPQIDKRFEPETIPETTLIDEEKRLTNEWLSYKIKKKRITVGRNIRNDIVINKDTVSASHAVILYEKGCFYIKDDRSTNGTIVNETLIRHNDMVRLRGGDQIVFADYRFRFETVLLHADETVIMLQDMVAKEPLA